MTANQKYERNQKAKGLVKITTWVPASAAIEFKQVAQFCCDNKNCVPYMARNLTTHRFVKAV